MPIHLVHLTVIVIHVSCAQTSDASKRSGERTSARQLHTLVSRGQSRSRNSGSSWPLDSDPRAAVDALVREDGRIGNSARATSWAVGGNNVVIRYHVSYRSSSYVTDRDMKRILFALGVMGCSLRCANSVTDTSAGPTNGLIALTLRDAAGHLQIFTISADGSKRTQLTSVGDNGRADWSPDGKKLTFMSIRNDHLWVAVMDADGSNQKMLLDGVSPDWSPDGKRIAFSLSDPFSSQIWVMNADGTGATQITHSATFKAGPSWSPDGKQMAFILLKNPGSQTDPQPEIGIVDVDGRNERILTSTDRTNTCLAPDGTRIFMATANDANAPAWSPVDNRIAFWSGIENQYGQVWIINADGSDSAQLTEECSRRNNDDPSWSPDGKKILFSTGRSGRNELWMMDANGGNETRISDIDAVPFPGRASWQQPVVH